MTPPRASKRAWIEAGLRALGEGGVDAVRVEPLARRLGLTKGSFYWHFENRRALLDAVLEEWERKSVSAVIEAVEAGGGDERHRLRALFAIASEGGELVDADLAVRDWAQRDELAAARLRAVDTRRFDYLRELFGGLGAGEADGRALLAFSLWLANPSIAADHPGRTRAQILDQATELLESADRATETPGRR